MTYGKEAIETKMTDMIANAASLAAIRRIFVGVVPDMKYDYTPAIEMVIETWDMVTAMTGTFKHWRYSGSFLVTVANQDLITATTRVYRVPTYTALTTYVDALGKLFSAEDNDNLDGLTFTNGAVINVKIAEDGLVYGAARLNERDNNMFNMAIVPFSVLTSEQDV